jgi:hypothetical protein
LQLGEEMAYVGLDRLLGQKEPLTDLPVDEAVGDELKHLDLAGCRLLLELPQHRRCERDHGAGPTRAATRGSRLEATAVVSIAIEDLLALSSVHAADIGLAEMTL